MPVRCLETFAQRAQAELVRFAGIGTATTRSIVANADLKPSVRAGAFDPYRPALRTNGNSMMHGVFSQRLYREGRQVEVERFRINLQIHFQPVLIAELFKGKILS